MHGLAMGRSTVAALTLRDHLVLCLVTGGALELGVLVRAAGQFLEGRVMARRAGAGRDCIRIGHLKGHMGLMTGQAIGLGLTLDMGCMTMDAIRNEFMFFPVAGAAGHGGVLAFLLLELGHLLGVTGETGIGEVAGQADDQRRVRVVMATAATGQLVMVGPGMALAAGGDDLLDLGRVTGMAVHAGDRGFMGRAAAGNVLGRLVMALDAVHRG